ncbi:MAG: MFS transporter [Candidatus Schekmanbacteria bacterium]|nr:MFS transporter [Candidatus Schekmanbacteria bacterium]
MLSMVVLVGLGEKMAERFLPIYLMALGAGAVWIGVLNGLDNLLSALYSFPGGYLADRLGTKRALLVFNLVAMAGFVVVIAIPSWIAVLAGAVFFLSWTAISLPATMSLVAKVLPRNKRTMGVSVHSLVRRIPMALGPVIGGVLIHYWGEVLGVRMAFVVALLLAGTAAIAQQALIEDDAASPAAASPAAAGGSGGDGAEKNPIVLFREMSPQLRNLLVGDILIRFCEQIPYAFVVVWCMKAIAAPVGAVQFGALTAIEMATAVLIYIPVAYLADRGAKKPFVLMTFVFFTIFPLVLYFSRSFWPLAGAFVLRGLKEFGEPTRKALIMDLAPENRKAAMFGLYYLLRDIVVSLAAFSSGVLWMISPAANFFTAFACGLAGTIWFAAFGDDLASDNKAGGMSRRPAARSCGGAGAPTSALKP